MFVGSSRSLMLLWRSFVVIPVEDTSTGTVCTMLWCNICFIPFFLPSSVAPYCSVQIFLSDAWFF